MTLVEAHDVTKRLRFRGGLSVLRASVGFRIDERGPLLTTAIRAPDREAWNSAVKPITQQYRMTPEYFALLDERSFIELIVGQFKELILHETMEGVWLNDKQVCDPHGQIERTA